MNSIYFPILKTRDAELRALNNLSKSSLEKICPIYELTKSRRTSKVPDGDIHRRMKIISEIQGNNEFVLDLATDENYSNPQIEQLLSADHGFADWYYFITENYRDLNIIPTVHMYEDDSGVSDQVTIFVSRISQIKQKIALRLPHDLDEAELTEYIQTVVSAMNENCELLIILDAGHVQSSSEFINQTIGSFIDSCTTIEPFSSRLCGVVIACSTFPSDVKSSGGHDSAGEFLIFEEKIYTDLSAMFSFVKCGDYGSINTEQIEMRGGTFVPRIDIVAQDCNSFFYKRFRRDEGSYPKCARHVIADSRYVDNSWWSNNEIRLASENKPNGISPAYWISVRVEYYIRMKLQKRADDLTLPEY